METILEFLLQNAAAADREKIRQAVAEMEQEQRFLWTQIGNHANQVAILWGVVLLLSLFVVVLIGLHFYNSSRIKRLKVRVERAERTEPILAA